MLYPDTGGPEAAWDGNYSNFMPRAGFSWQPTPKTAVRGGYGLFYDVLGPNRISANQTGYSRVTRADAVARQRPDLRRHAGQPVPERPARAGRQPGLGLMTNVGLRSSASPIVGEVRTPRTHRWSIGLQRELPGILLIEATYVGLAASTSRCRASSTRCRAVLLDVAGPRRRHQQLPDAAGAESVRRAAAGHQHQRRERRAQQLLRPYPQFTSIMALETIGTSDYTSFQGRVERRMANGFTVRSPTPGRRR